MKKEIALTLCIAFKAEIDEIIERLDDRSTDHFSRVPDEVDWDHIRSFAYYCIKLRDAANAAFAKGK